jgi:NADH-quinone oxidoreductase subunit J
MNATVVIFYIISAFILGAGLLSVLTRRIFRSAIWLLCSLIGVAGLYFWMEVEFIAAVQIVVYVGGIVVLILFSIFLTQQSGKEMVKPLLSRTIISIALTVIGFLFTCMVIQQNNFQPINKEFNWTVATIGTQMLNTGAGGFALPFEVVSILLLAAMIGCIVIAMRPRHDESSKINQPKTEVMNPIPNPTSRGEELEVK